MTTQRVKIKPDTRGSSPAMTEKSREKAKKALSAAC
jgi:hypothetical protein